MTGMGVNVKFTSAPPNRLLLSPSTSLPQSTTPPLHHSITPLLHGPVAEEFVRQLGITVHRFCGRIEPPNGRYRAPPSQKP